MTKEDLKGKWQEKKWEEELYKVTIMKRALMLKYSQNLNMLKILLETGNKKVVERSEREVLEMKKRTMKGMMMRRAFCSAMAFAMVFSSLVLPQGVITVYAEEEPSSSSALVAKIVPVSSNKVTQIKERKFYYPQKIEAVAYYIKLFGGFVTNCA